MFSVKSANTPQGSTCQSGSELSIADKIIRVVFALAFVGPVFWSLRVLSHLVLQVPSSAFAAPYYAVNFLVCLVGVGLALAGLAYPLPHSPAQHARSTSSAGRLRLIGLVLCLCSFAFVLFSGAMPEALPGVAVEMPEGLINGLGGVTEAIWRLFWYSAAISWLLATPFALGGHYKSLVFLLALAAICLVGSGIEIFQHGFEMEENHKLFELLAGDGIFETILILFLHSAPGGMAIEMLTFLGAGIFALRRTRSLSAPQERPALFNYSLVLFLCAIFMFMAAKMHVGFESPAEELHRTGGWMYPFTERISHFDHPLYAHEEFESWVEPLHSSIFEMFTSPATYFTQLETAGFIVIVLCIAGLILVCLQAQQRTFLGYFIICVLACSWCALEAADELETFAFWLEEQAKDGHVDSLHARHEMHAFDRLHSLFGKGAPHSDDPADTIKSQDGPASSLYPEILAESDKHSGYLDQLSDLEEKIIAEIHRTESAAIAGVQHLLGMDEKTEDKPLTRDEMLAQNAARNHEHISKAKAKKKETQNHPPVEVLHTFTVERPESLRAEWRVEHPVAHRYAPTIHGLGDNLFVLYRHQYADKVLALSVLASLISSLLAVRLLRRFW